MSVHEHPEAVLRPELSFDRTVSRRLVHRFGLEEVFLTDFQSLEKDGPFLAAARLPRAHAYYGDHLGHPRAHDPLAVFECVRQALLCATHLHHDAPTGTKAITAECRLEITDPAALLLRAGDERGYDLELRGRVDLAKHHEGVLSRVVHAVEVQLCGAKVGTVTVDTALRPPAVYEKIRLKDRSTTPPMSDRLGHQETPSDLPAHLAGRRDADNVVLTRVEPGEGALTALLRIPVSHTGMFDHPQDHLPGPVMMEAARQAGLLLLTEEFGRTPAKTQLVSLTAGYRRFAELDSPITVHAQLAPGADPREGAYELTVEFRQEDAAVARMELRFAATERQSGKAHSGEVPRAL
ncbi:AfsA-related hotdog domain-containing protein [Streptomyces physcomitrii]|uniref:A-factor biosynthesis hotdog domain-containing protein n=1 Tax=Streptomyces physcomitrii TaxID=2724184 RepID=A0ABX1GWX5_9ACTN|nr:AfsA-related hotdog domain-containing protein [Streptomyces physcomitrii]NKI40577.1 hypothetical protein [Streptomyces physcomitrii]